MTDRDRTIAIADTGPSIRCGSIARTHDEVKARAARIATGLHGLGVRRDDRVAVALRNDLAVAEISVATGLLGASPVPINWHWREEEIRHVLTNSDSVVAFVHSDLLPAITTAAPDIAIVEVPVTADLAEDFHLSSEQVALTGSALELNSWLAQHEPWSQPMPPASMSVIYTSGTTGAPKGILSHPASPEEAASIGKLAMKGLALAGHHHTLVVAPLYHSAPNRHLLFAFALGLDITIMPRFDAEAMLRLIQDEGINHVQLVPTMFVRLLKLPEKTRRKYDLSSLESVVHAAAPCPPDVKRRMIEWLGPIVHELYGGSETGVITISDSHEWLTHPGSVGRPVEDADVRIVGEDGTVLGAGQTGYIYVKPPSMWPDFSFIDDDAKRAEMERDGYVTIGDIGCLDEDGFLYLSDRSHDMVISGGVNIYPAEIENCLYALDAVRDVAVIGIPDEEFGEALAAHIEVEPGHRLTQQEVRDHVAAHLAKYKAPKVVVFDDDLPREDSGKLFKRRLRDRYRADTRVG